MQDHIIIWLSLLACLTVIGVEGVKLSRYGDIIAEKSGMSRSWVGLILLATVTSLPELVTGLSAVTVARVPDIAVGDIMGSCVFNLLIIVLLDFLYRKESVYTRARQGNVLAAGYGIALIGFAGFNLLLYRAGAIPSIGHVGLYTPVILLLYLLAMRSLYRYEKAQVSEYVEDRVEIHPDVSLKQAVQGYALASVAVMAAGIWLPFIARDMAAVMAWQQSFVGTLFVAAVTSAPEVVVTVAALRMGVADLAIGNLFGSNLFNIAILAIDDLAYLPGPLLADVSLTHATSAFSAMMMSGLAVVGLVLRPASRVLRTVSWISLLLLVIYLLNTWFFYLYG
ncbi:MAG: cation transporter [Hydrogenophilales bacterium CG03_land_8_20_14_0_80_62_28]|nr:sodium:calcium antiporter [Betaproteobacteria bacterium]OIO77721.1 MAG: cation transporter [Hydrogenophilaceae bacterium CG1_02_62_390]PIV24701.1 MAG: cation transporter [Hydrogenophilales bacterium CG03_land_8_20_14_0_80_62_28]PIW38525.1 MAG: cation transporter [Hydrogenophilales bacterium CG15_BIG_FIL_POST_REV_8_21_14_020_62_31]PIW71276.1 MAG: cation transporter [Hydrogenophilales bacterium CG12_big_fil_rev_8_21_14_0_65_61_21]PIX02104.1 MAG: cation transporter [Hydrogenophilales bacterium